MGRPTRTFRKGKGVMSMKIHQQLSTWEGQVPTQLLLHGVAYLDFLKDPFLDRYRCRKGKVQEFGNTT